MWNVRLFPEPVGALNHQYISAANVSFYNYPLILSSFLETKLSSTGVYRLSHVHFPHNLPPKAIDMSHRITLLEK